MSTASSGAGSREKVVVFRQVRVVLPYRVTKECDLIVRQRRIASMVAEFSPASEAIVVEARGLYAAPGLIDIHCHSDGRSSFFEQVEAVAGNLLHGGTTGVLATLAYCDMAPGRLREQVEAFWAARGAVARQTVLGVHLEGPYTNPDYGALVRPGQAHPPDPSEYEPVLERCSEIVRLWTIAPELPGIAAFARAAAAHKVLLAAGHTEAVFDQLLPLIPLGLRVATHWSNATGTPPPRFAGTRTAGIDEFALIHDNMMAEVICDSGGCHVSPAMLQLLYRAKGPDGIILISDAYWSEGGQASVRPETDVHFTLDGRLNGSRLSVLAAAKNFRRAIGCSLPEIFRMGALNPARLFGWAGEVGSLEPGKLANILLVDDDLNLRGVWLAGRPIVGVRR